MDDRIARYLEVVPIEALAAAGLAGLFVMLAIPARSRMRFALTAAVVWLTIGKLPDLGAVAALAKAGVPAPLVVVGIAAKFHPGPRVRMPRFAAIYFWVAMAAIVFVASGDDALVQIIVRLEWVLALYAGVKVAETMVDESSRRAVLTALANGFALSLVPLAVGLRLDPEVMFFRGHSRFSVWGSHPNSIGMSTMLAAVVCLLAALNGHRRRTMMLVALAAGGMTLLTFGRTTIIATAFVALPMLLAGSRRDLLVAVLVPLGLAASLYGVLTLGPEESVLRIMTLESRRSEIAADYVEAVWDRPIVGLLMRSDVNAEVDVDVGAHTHNAFLSWLYIGGAVLAFPMFGLLAATLRAALRARRWDSGSILAGMGAILAGLYLTGVSHSIVYHPTDPTALVHAILAFALLGAVWPRSASQVGGLDQHGRASQLDSAGAGVAVGARKDAVRHDR